jgi:dipeptidyl aminopeptidase/acylaminoacyl peptidase
MFAGTVERRPLTDQLIELICEEGAAPVGLTGVHGAGGFGKTTMAAWICHQPDVRKRFPGGLLWVTLGEHVSGADLAGRVNDLAEHLTGVRPAFSDPLQAGLHLGQLLDAQPDPVLLVVDDVWAEYQLQPFRCGGAQCRRLVTTRNRWVLADGAHVPVDAMTSDEARRLLTRDIPEPPGDLVAELLAATGRWPVLLALANRAAVTAVAYGTTGARALAQIAARLAEEGPVAFDVDDGYQRNRAVAATVRAGLHLLPAATADRFIELAIMGEDSDIPAAVLELLWGATGGLTNSGVRRTCEALAELSLVNYRPDPGSVRLHDVIRSYLIHVAGPTRLRELHNRLLDAAAPLVPADGDSAPVAWWRLPDCYDYLLANLAGHLIAAGREADLAALVTDLRWVETRLRRHGVAGVEADLARVPSRFAGALSRLIHQNGHLFAPTIAPYSLGAVLASRLEAMPELEPLVRVYRATLPRPVLEPAWPVPDLLNPAEPDALEHTGGLLCCSFSPDGRALATGSDDCSVRIRSLAGGGRATSFVGHTARVRACVFSADGSYLATASDDRSVRLWRIGSGDQDAVLGHPGGVRDCAFSPSGNRLVTATEDGTARIWGLEDRAVQVVFNGHLGAVNSCVFSPDGAAVATGGQDGSIRVWETVTGEQLHVFEGFHGPVNSCAFSPSGEILAATDDQSVSLWTISDATRRIVTVHDSRIYSCSFSNDGSLMATACSDSKVRLLNVTDGSVVTVLEGHTDVATSCSFSPDGSLVASTSHDQSARVWSVGTGSAVKVFTGGRRRLSGCSFSPKGDLLATAHDDARGTIWDGTGRMELVRLMGHRSRLSKCSFSPDGSLVITTSADKTARLWRSSTGDLVAELRGHRARVRGCAFAPDGKTVATTSDDRTIRLWSIDGRPRLSLVGHDGRVGSCSFSCDSAILASASEDRSVRLWRVSDGSQVAVLAGHRDMVTCCAFSPDGALLASTSFDETTRLWRLSDNVPVATLSGHLGWVESCAFSPTGRELATLGRDSTIRIWNVGTGRCECAFRVASPLICVAWHPSGTKICAVGGAGLYMFRYLAS